MRRHQPSEDVATEPYAARGDDASGTFCLREKLFKRNFVLQKLVAVQEMIPNDRMVIFDLGRLIPITLNHSLPTLQEDFRKSKDEILKSQKIVQGLQGDKLSPNRPGALGRL